MKKLEELYLCYNNIEDITPINNISSLKEYIVHSQAINKTITSGREIALPQILIDAKNSSSKAYVGNISAGNTSARNTSAENGRFCHKRAMIFRLLMHTNTI